MKKGIAGLLLVVVSVAVDAAPVVVGEKAWRQLTETMSFTWSGIASVCSETTGTCAGSLFSTPLNQQVSFDGWTWATNDDIQALFEQIILPGTAQFPTNASSYSGPGIADVFAPGMFLPTGTYAMERGVWGTSRTSESTTSVYTPVVIDYFSDADVASLSSSRSKAGGLYPGGVWLYQSATPVPLPAAAWLMLSGVGALGLLQRRRRSREA